MWSKGPCFGIVALSLFWNCCLQNLWLQNPAFGIPGFEICLLESSSAGSYPSSKSLPSQFITEGPVFIAFMHSSPQTLEIYSIRPPNPGICSTFSARSPPNPRICSLCWISSVWFEKIEPVVSAQNEVRTRSERDADLHILAPTQGKTGIALKVLRKQAFKFKDLRNWNPGILQHFSAMTPPNAGICSTFTLPPKSWNLQHLECNEAPKCWNLQHF